MSSAGTLVDGVDIDALAAAVRDCPAVAELARGRVAAAVTYLPGRRVTGVRVADNTIDIDVVLRWPHSVSQLVSQVRAGVARHAGDRRVDIAVVDVALPGDGELADPSPDLPTS